MNFDSLSRLKEQKVNSEFIASVFVRVKNEIHGISEFWNSLSAQTVFGSLEIVFLDSGSEDGTLEYILSLNASVYSIDKEEFAFGSTCNLGMKLTSTSWVYFFSGHIVLNQPDLIEYSLSKVIKTWASGYFKQVPNYKIGASIYDIVYLEFAFKTYKNRIGSIKVSKRENRFSNAASVVNRKHWEDLPFEDVVASEDYFWSTKALSNKHTILYFQNYSVQHSHNESFEQIRKRVRINALARHPNGVSTFKRILIFLKVFLGILVKSGRPLISFKFAKSHSKGYKF